MPLLCAAKSGTYCSPRFIAGRAQRGGIMADYPGATDHNVPPSFMFDSNTHSAIVLHKPGGDATPDAIYRTFLPNGKSKHYGVGTDCCTLQYVLQSIGRADSCCVTLGYN